MAAIKDPPMVKRKFTLEQGMAPENLKLLMAGDQAGYKLAYGYSAELRHGLMGYFPAIYYRTRNIVLTFDPELMRDVLKKLSPRALLINENKYLVNEAIGVAYHVTSSGKDDDEKSHKLFPLVRTEFDWLCKNYDQPFEWGPGLVSDDMTADEFARTIEAAMESIRCRNAG